MQFYVAWQMREQWQIKPFGGYALIKCSATLCCYLKAFNLSLELLAINAEG